MAKTKPELVKDAKKLGIALTGTETVPQLKALIKSPAAATATGGTTAAAASVQGPGATASTAPASADSTGITTAPKSGSVDVIKGDNGYIRTYSEENHGDNWFDLAREFVTKPAYSKRGYRLVDSADVPKVVVLYREKKDADLHPDDQDPNAPNVDKEKAFEDKDAAVAFNVEKKGSLIAPGLKK